MADWFRGSYQSRAARRLATRVVPGHLRSAGGGRADGRASTRSGAAITRASSTFWRRWRLGMPRSVPDGGRLTRRGRCPVVRGSSASPLSALTTLSGSHLPDLAFPGGRVFNCDPVPYAAGCDPAAVAAARNEIDGQVYMGDGSDVEIGSRCQINRGCRLNRVGSRDNVMIGPDVIVARQAAPHRRIDVPMIDQGDYEKARRSSSATSGWAPARSSCRVSWSEPGCDRRRRRRCYARRGVPDVVGGVPARLITRRGGESASP